MFDYLTMLAWFRPVVGRFLANGPKNQEFFDGQAEMCMWFQAVAVGTALELLLVRRETLSAKLE